MGFFGDRQRSAVAVVVTTDGRRVTRARARPQPRTYPFSTCFARSLPGLTAFLASSLPAPGGRTEERGGTSATEAPATEDRRDPRRVARVFACSGGRGACRTEGTKRMTMTKGEPPTGGPADRARPAQPRARRRVGGGGRGRAGAQGHAPRRRGRASGRGSAPTRSWRRSSARAPTSCSATRAASSSRSTTSSATTPRSGTSSSATSRAAATPPTATPAPAAGSACAWAPAAPGATNLVTGDRHRAAGLGPDGRDHRQRARRADRQGRVPGDRHHRHHAADDQAQLPGPERRRHPARRRRGVPPRPLRPARVPSTSTSPRTPCSRRRAPSTPPSTTSSPACPASAPPSTATPSSSSSPPGRSPRRKRPLILAGHGVLIADGWRRAPGVRGEDAASRSPGRCWASARSTSAIRWPTATWACTAGSTSTARSSRPTC